MAFTNRSLPRIALWAAAFAFSGTAFAQQAQLSLGSGGTVPGGTINLNLSLATSGGAQPSSFEWTMTYAPTDVASVSIAAGASATAAGKQATCATSTGSTVCLLYGMNENVIGAGVLATVTVGIASGTLDTSTPIQVTGVDVSAANGSQISGAGSSGVVAISQPQPTSLSCTPASVTAPGSATCTVAVSQAAAAGGLSVTLASNNTSVTVPASILIAGGATSGTFTATVAAVSTNQSATLTASASGASQTFSLGVSAPTWTISGAISPASLGSGVTVALSGAASQTAAADSNGNYTFSNLANGSYTITPSKTGYTFTPASQAVTVNGANQTGVNFTASAAYSAPTVDVQVSENQGSSSSTITSPQFSTASPNELLLAFVSTGSGATVESITGGSLSWVLVVRTAVQGGSAEIWRAFSAGTLSNVSVQASLSKSVISSLTIRSFKGADPSGTNGSGAVGATGTGNAASGAPAASLVTTRNNSLVMGVGDLTKETAAPKPDTGQSLVHDYASNTARFWVQAVTNPVALSGTSVTVGDTAPTTTAYNLSIVEVLAAPASSAASLVSKSIDEPRSAPGQGDPAIGNPVRMSSPGGSLTKDVCSPGGLASLEGTGFTSQSPQAAASSPLPTRLAGVQVLVNERAAPLLFVSASRVNFQCPRIPAGTTLRIALRTEQGSEVLAGQAVMVGAAPEIFTLGGTSQAVALLDSGELSGAPDSNGVRGRSARRGERVTIYASGLGDVVNTAAEGTPAPMDRPSPLKQPVRAFVGDAEASVLFAGLAPGTVGLFEVSLQIPQDAPAGAAVPVRLEVATPEGAPAESNIATIEVEGPQLTRLEALRQP